MKEHRLGIIMNGVTGRMGTNQHLMRSIVEIIKQGGVDLGNGEVIMPDPILVGRNAAKLAKLSAISGVNKYTTDLASVLDDPSYSIYFDAQTTGRRAADVLAAIAKGKHIYCEKPVATDVDTALKLYAACEKAGVKHGVVQDKLWLPGLRKLNRLIEQGFFGEILSVKGDFGYWVFEGDTIPAQRPSWNYRSEDGGGMIVDMHCHWRYVIDNLFGKVTRVFCKAATHIDQRRNESGEMFPCTADDSAYAMFETDTGVICQFNSSWAVRVRRDDLLTMQVDGTEGSAIVGLRKCWVQHQKDTPRPVWNPDIDSPLNFYDNWTEVTDDKTYDNAFKIQWEMFLKHVVADVPFPWTLREGAKGVQLAELSWESNAKGAWVDVP